MGRAANNACVFTIAGASMAVVEMGPVAVMIASVPLVVAADLGISMRMVQRHLTSIYAKTGTQSRTGLTSKFLSQGINAANEQGSGTCSHVQREA